MLLSKKVPLLGRIPVPVRCMGILLLLYISGVIYFTHHLFFSTTINNVRCGGMTLSRVISTNQKLVEKYVLTVIDQSSNRFEVHGQDIHLSYVSSEEEKIFDLQNPFLWPLSFFSSFHYELPLRLKYEEECLNELIYAQRIFQEDCITPPRNARLYIEEDAYGIQSEIEGNLPIFAEIKSKINKSISCLEDECLLDYSCYAHPLVRASDQSLREELLKLQTMLNTTIVYDIPGRQEVLDADDIRNFLFIEQNAVKIDTSKVEQYVQQLATTYNTYGKKRRFATSLGDTIVIGGGDYGWVIDKTKETEQIIHDLSSGLVVNREPVFSQRGEGKWSEALPSTYVEIDYTNQHAYYYKDHLLIQDFDIVSGNMKENNGSPDGIFYIRYKTPNASLKGQDYTTFVHYFVPFAYNIGFHDATWRDRFGKNFYLENGSHGCINVALSDMEKFYANITVDTAVIAYYRTPVRLSSKNANICNAFSKAAVEEE